MNAAMRDKGAEAEDCRVIAVISAISAAQQIIGAYVTYVVVRTRCIEFSTLNYIKVPGKITVLLRR